MTEEEKAKLAELKKRGEDLAKRVADFAEEVRVLSECKVHINRKTPPVVYHGKIIVLLA